MINIVMNTIFGGVIIVLHGLYSQHQWMNNNQLQEFIILEIEESIYVTVSIAYTNTL